MARLSNPAGPGVRVLRTLLGSEMTQAKFGALVGVSMDTIRSIENGRLGLSDQIKARIHRATGCDPCSLHKVAVLTSNGEAYSSAWFTRWDAQIKSRVAGKDSAQLFAEMAGKLRQLVEVAGSRGRTEEIFHSFQRWVESVSGEV